LLEGKNVNLRVMGKEYIPLIIEWGNDPDFWGEFEFTSRMSRADVEKTYANFNPEVKWFFVEKKDGSKIGCINHRRVGKAQELGFIMLPSQRGKGYCSEAAMIMVDHLFLTKDIVRIQAHTDTQNVASQSVLEKAGFRIEVVQRQSFVGDEWRGTVLYSILREEWKEPKILTKTSS
jgi:RimJ/RimL family protein N-acetyltransferase